MVSNVLVPPVSVQSTPFTSVTGAPSAPQPKFAPLASTTIVLASGALITIVNGPPTPLNLRFFQVPLHVPASVSDENASAAPGARTAVERRSVAQIRRASSMRAGSIEPVRNQTCLDTAVCHLVCRGFRFGPFLDA